MFSLEEFLGQQHLNFIQELDGRIKKLDYWQAEYLRMSGIYWALTALLLLKPELDPLTDEFDQISPLTKCQVLDFIAACQCTAGGFGGNVGHDAHLTFTLSAIQILVMIKGLDDTRINLDLHIRWIKERQNEDGSFTGDGDGEIDTRFSYCAISALNLLNRLDAINVEDAINFIEKCHNFDGGYGAIPGGESHAGQIFCCIGALKILNRPIKNADRSAEWLAWRQLQCGGLNGRPEKLEDVCYSWWVLSSLSMLNRIDWIGSSQLQDFILSCQDKVSGGFSDRPGDMGDVFHTVFGIAGLSLLGVSEFAQVDPRYCMPTKTLESRTTGQ